jgi:hypothetical protein
MSEQNSGKPFKEAVCVDVMRVFDSCSSQECLEDLEFSFDCENQNTINAASYIKSKCITVSGVNFAIAPVPFNPGFYTVDVTYNFRAEIEAYSGDNKPPIIVYGKASFSKKVVLYGSVGNTQRFVSGEESQPSVISQTSGCSQCCPIGTPPTAAVTIVEPMCLDAKLVTVSAVSKKVLITIGIFAIVQLERPVSLMVPSFDYCVPEKECSTNSDSPCELFDKIKFPTNEFFPQGLDDTKCCCTPTDTSETQQNTETTE